MASSSSPPDSLSSLKSILHTPRLTLTVFDENRPDNCDHVIVCFQDPVSMQAMGDYGIRNHQQLKALSDNLVLSPSFSNGKVPRGMAAYNIHLGSTPSDPTIGVLSLAQRSKTVPPDIGWIVLHQYAGHGYATEAAREFFGYMTEDCGVMEMVAIVKPTNVVSIKIAEKLGFVESGELLSDDGIPKLVYTMNGKKQVDPESCFSFYGDGEQRRIVREMSTGTSGH
ncbi:hypothetical protein MMC26_000920 [Xylographa opegraphella]|nr:hypothetical protein [Xylographa opegraphella]